MSLLFQREHRWICSSLLDITSPTLFRFPSLRLLFWFLDLLEQELAFLDALIEEVVRGSEVSPHRIVDKLVGMK